MDSVASWLVLVVFAIFAFFWIISKLPNKPDHAYDRYNTNLDKKREKYWC